MKPNDFDTFSGIIVGFAEIKGRKLSSAGIGLYWNAIQRQGWTIEDFTAAAEQLLNTSDFMPEPKDFANLRKAGRATSGESWAQVLEFVRRDYSPHGDYRRNPPAGLSGATLRAVEAIGGFRAIAMSNSEATHFLGKRFTENFEEIRDISDTREAVPQIAQTDRPQLTGPRPAIAVEPGKVQDVKRIGVAGMVKQLAAKR